MLRSCSSGNRAEMEGMCELLHTGDVFWPSSVEPHREGPMVRIHLPPAASQQRTVTGGGLRWSPAAIHDVCSCKLLLEFGHFCHQSRTFFDEWSAKRDEARQNGERLWTEIVDRLRLRADEQFHKNGSEDWQSTLTRAPLFANLFFDRLAALGSRAVNAPFRGLCFVALFDQVVDCRLLACVSSVDLPWRCGGHSDSPRPVAAFSAFSSRSSIRLDWKGRPFHRGYRKRRRAAPQSAEAAAVPVVPAGCLAASAFRADLPLLNSAYSCRRDLR